HFQQVGGEAVAEGVATDRLAQPCLLGRLMDRPLQGRLVDVMSAGVFAAGVVGEALQGKDELPAQVSGSRRWQEAVNYRISRGEQSCPRASALLPRNLLLNLLRPQR